MIGPRSHGHKYLVLGRLLYFYDILMVGFKFWNFLLKKKAMGINKVVISRLVFYEIKILKQTINR